MHQSGITVSEGLKADFNAACEDADSLFIKIEIKDDDFVKTAQGNKTGSAEGDFAAVQDALEDKAPCYVLMKDGAKWCVVFYVPEGSIVRMKMVYASSTSSLKSGLGGAFFNDDFPISDKDECTLPEFTQARSDVTENVMTPDEKMNRDTHYEASHTIGASEVKQIVGIPIKIADSVLAALAEIKAATKQTVELVLDPATEILGCCDPTDLALGEWSFPDKEPRYYIHNYVHEHGGESKTKLVFVYYCPTNSPPKLKMFYSTVKASIVKLLNSQEMEGYCNVECDSRDECTNEVIMNEIYPKAAADKTFKKPTARGRGRAKVAKFQG